MWQIIIAQVRIIMAVCEKLRVVAVHLRPVLSLLHICHLLSLNTISTAPQLHVQHTLQFAAPFLTLPAKKVSQQRMQVKQTSPHSSSESSRLRLSPR